MTALKFPTTITVVILLVTICYSCVLLPNQSTVLGEANENQTNKALFENEGWRVVDRSREVRGMASHDPISILSDQDWEYKAQEEGWPGSGTVVAPYVISSYVIYTGEMDPVGILVSDTTVYFTIQNVEIYGSGGMDEQGFSLDSVENGLIINNYFTGLATGVSVTNSGNLRLEGNLVENSALIGYVFDSCYEVEVVDNVADRNLDGFSVQNSNDLTFVDNRAVNNARNGFFTQFLTYGNFTANEAHTNRGSGYAISSTEDSIIIGNMALENIGHGFYLYSDTTRVVLENNNATLNDLEGFYLMNLSNATIRSNLALQNGDCGYNIRYLSSSYVDNNRAIGSGQFGFTSHEGTDIVFSNNYASNNGWGGFSHKRGRSISSTNDTAVANNILGFRAIDTYDTVVFQNTVAYDNEVDFILAPKQSLDFVLPVGKQLALSYTTTTQDFFSLMRDDVEVDRGTIEDEIVLVVVAYDLPGDYVFYLQLYTNGVAQESFTIPVTIKFLDKPFITHQEELGFSEGSTDNYLVWYPYGSGGLFALYRNEVLVRSESWSSGLPIMHNVDHLSAGDHLFVLSLKDSLGQQVEQAVNVMVYDDQAPEVQDLPDFQLEESDELVLSWVASDRHPSHYNLFVDGLAVIEQQKWSSLIPVTATLPELAVGEHYILVEFYDWSDNAAIDGLVVTVVDTTSPVVIGSVTNLGTTTTVSWSLTDSHPSHYSMFVQDTLVRSNNWTSGEVVTLTVDELDEGTTNFTIMAFDAFGNWFTNEVVAHVRTENITNQTTVTTTVAGETTTLTETTTTTIMTSDSNNGTTDLANASSTNEPSSTTSPVPGFILLPFIGSISFLVLIQLKKRK